jgi:hypothetical protein
VAIESELFGSCVDEIDVSVDMENRGVWLCCGSNYLGFILEKKSCPIFAVEVGDGARYWRAF